MGNLPQKDLCPRIEIADYIDGELDSVRLKEFEQHLATCATCKEDLSFQKHLKSVLDEANYPEVEVPSNYAEVVIATAKSQVGTAPRRFEAVRFALICVFMFSLLGVSLVALSADISGSEVSPLFLVFSKAFNGIRNVVFGFSSIAHSVCIYSIFRSILRIVIFSFVCVAASVFVYRMFNRYKEGSLK